MTEILFKDESYKIIGACFEVYNQKGSGFTEPVYQECLQLELSLQNIPFVAQPELQLEYKGTPNVQAGLHLLRKHNLGDQSGRSSGQSVPSSNYQLPERHGIRASSAGQLWRPSKA